MSMLYINNPKFSFYNACSFYFLNIFKNCLVDMLNMRFLNYIFDFW